MSEGVVEETQAAAGPAERPRRRFFRRRPKDEKRRRKPFELRKALFILPNAFTVASIFCGFYAIVLSTSGAGPEAFDQAGISLIFAAFFDAFDGRVARLTRTQSDFGVQLDSLADVMSFGLAPAILVYNWAFKDHQLGMLGVVLCFGFAACGAIRLARFNVLAARGAGSSKYFIGLPIPGAASMLVSVIMAQSHNLGTSVERIGSVAVLVVVLSYLMVSRVRFRTFKDFRPRMRTAPIVLAILMALVVAVLVLKARLALVFLVGSYITLGLVEEVVFFRPRRAAHLQEKSARAAAEAAAAAPVEDPPPSPAH